jgi:hypothetical protein
MVTMGRGLGGNGEGGYRWERTAWTSVETHGQDELEAHVLTTLDPSRACAFFSKLPAPVPGWSHTLPLRPRLQHRPLARPRICWLVHSGPFHGLSPAWTHWLLNLCPWRSSSSSVRQGMPVLWGHWEATGKWGAVWVEELRWVAALITVAVRVALLWAALHSWATPGLCLLSLNLHPFLVT